MQNKKTTIAGYLVIAGAVLYAVARFLQSGTVDGETVKAVFAAVAGSGLVMAQDGGH